MNITDIDDKIIRRARQYHLYDEYVASQLPLEQLLNDQKDVLRLFQVKCDKNTDPDKKVMLENLLQRMNDAVDALTQAISKGDEEEVFKSKSRYLVEAKDPIAEWLDDKYSANINDNVIFEALPRYWEDQFHNDMKSLNVSNKKYNFIYDAVHNCFVFLI